MTGNLLLGDNAIRLHYSRKSKRLAVNPNAVKEYSCFAGGSEIADIDNELPL